jgi:hypothetical protein
MQVGYSKDASQQVGVRKWEGEVTEYSPSRPRSAKDRELGAEFGPELVEARGRPQTETELLEGT